MADNDIYANPPDPEVLELESVHPGIGDAAYVARRHELFALCRQHRLGASARPSSTTPPRSNGSGARSSPKLDELHARHASRIYLQAKRDLGISADRNPAAARR